MALEIFGTTAPSTESPQLAARLVRDHMLICLRLEVFANPQTAGIPTRFACW